MDDTLIHLAATLAYSLPHGPASVVEAVEQLNRLQRQLDRRGHDGSVREPVLQRIAAGIGCTATVGLRKDGSPAVLIHLPGDAARIARTGSLCVPSR